MPVYNRELLIADAVDSILHQTYGNFELLLMDDGSTDNTSSILQSYKDSRIRIYRSEINRGIECTLNDGIDLAKGKYIARMDSDDISEPERLKLQVSYLEKHPDVGVLGTAAWRTGKLRKKIIRVPLSNRDIKTYMIFRNPMLHSTVMFRKELEGKRVRYPLGFRYAEDYKLWTDLSSHTRFANLPDILLMYRKHDGQVTVSKREESGISGNRIRLIYLKKNFPEFSDEQIDLHIRAFDRCKDISLAEARICLETLAETKPGTDLFNQELFLRLLAGKLHKCCRKSQLKGKEIHRMFRSSFLSKYANPGTKNTLKYYLNIILSH